MIKFGSLNYSTKIPTVWIDNDYNQPKYISELILECESDLARQVSTDILVLYFSLFNFVNKPRFLQDEANFTPFCWYQGIFMLSSDSKVIGF